MAYTPTDQPTFAKKAGSLAKKLAYEFGLISTEFAAISAGFPGGYETIRLMAGSAIPCATLGAAEASPAESSVNKVSTVYLDFDPDTQRYCQWNFILPNDYDDGVTVTAKVHWTAASGAGDVVWGVQARHFANDADIDQAFGTAIETTDTLITALDEHITPATAAITIAGTPVKNGFIVVQLYRKAAAAEDTLTVNARMLAVVLTYARPTA